METIFIFVSNFVYSSDLLRTDYIKYVSTKYKVIVFMPPQAFCADNKKYYQSPNITYVQWSMQFPKFWDIIGKIFRYSLIRKYDFEPVVIRNRKNSPQNWQRKIVRVISFLFPKSWITPDLFLKIELWLAPRSEKFEKYVKQYSPALVITATPGFNNYDAEAIVFAKRAKIKTAAINFSWDNLHNGGRNFRRTDYFVVWNEIIRGIAIREYGYAPEYVFVSGTMRFDNYSVGPCKKSREEFLLSKGLEPNEKTILVTTTTKGNYPDEDILLANLIKARDQGRFVGKPNIFVRMHPKEEFEKFYPYMDGKIKNVCVEYPGKKLSQEMGTPIELHEDDMENLKCTLAYTDVSINYKSTITLEAFIFDKPVININYPKKYEDGYTHRHYKPIIDADAVYLPHNFDELVEQVNISFKNPEQKHIGREKIFHDFTYFRDGKAYERNVDFIKKMI